MRPGPGKGDRASQVLPAGCDICRGEPFMVDERGATRCTCPRGQALRQMERGRAAVPQGSPATPRPVVYRSPLPETQ
jgi:hypothetical protein